MVPFQHPYTFVSVIRWRKWRLENLISATARAWRVVDTRVGGNYPKVALRATKLERAIMRVMRVDPMTATHYLLNQMGVR